MARGPGAVRGARADLHALDDIDGRDLAEIILEVRLAEYQLPIGGQTRPRHGGRTGLVKRIHRSARAPRRAWPTDNAKALKARSSVRMAIGRSP